MKRRLLHLLWIAILLASLVFSGCVREEINEGGKLDPDEQTLADTEPTEDYQPSALSTQTTASAGNAEIQKAWGVLQEARKNMAALKAVEENQILYTTIEDSEESISMRLTVTDIDTDDITIGAVGTVKTKGNVIPLEIYYKNGVMVRVSGGNSAKEDSTLENALATVDFLTSIRRDLTLESITSASMMETADGMVTISLQFTGTISGLPTTGRGELLLDADHLIASEGYSFEAINKEGKKVSQSVECTMLSFDQDVKGIDLPEELR